MTPLAAPGSLEEALELRRAHPEAVPVAGGTDVMVDVNAGRVPSALLDLSRVGADVVAASDEGHTLGLGLGYHGLGLGQQELMKAR
jgi:CO/xanthine dehydrogenase FAD-binding subunit